MMFHIQTNRTNTASRTTTANRTSTRRAKSTLPADGDEAATVQLADGTQPTRTKPLTHVMTKANNVWHLLGRLRKVRIEVSVDVKEPHFDNVNH